MNNAKSKTCEFKLGPVTDRSRMVAKASGSDRKALSRVVSDEQGRMEQILNVM